MKKFATALIALSVLILAQTDVSAQVNCTGDGGYVTNGNEIPCGDQQFPCCSIWDACNGPYSGCNNYDADFSTSGGCDLSCTPIDSGVLFLLIGGAAFGGSMIARNRRRELQLEAERV